VLWERFLARQAVKDLGINLGSDTYECGWNHDACQNTLELQDPVTGLQLFETFQHVITRSRACAVGSSSLHNFTLIHTQHRVHPKTLIEIAMVLSTNSSSFPSNTNVSATLSILLRFGEFWNPTNCEKFNADGSLMGRMNLDKSAW